MKQLFLPLVGFFFLTTQLVNSQEFTTHDNGLIYNEITMSKLAQIVDSLNLQYKYCDLNKTYYAKKQAIGHVVRLKKGAVIQAKKDMDRGLDFDTLVEKYPSATLEKELLFVSYKYKNYEDKEVMDIDEVSLNSNYGFGLYFRENVDKYETVKAGTWLYNFDAEDMSLDAIYFTTDMHTPKLTEKYARMIGYADCLIDTTATKFKKDASRGAMRRLPADWQQMPQEEKQSLLNSLRSTRVVGSCSMDTSPRLHAVNIALLSAETVNWEIFLRSHLDIMNDRFDRASDGSYAQAGRKTYIKELETLNINISDLIFGISLRVENPAKNHYYGTIYRIGRALTESKDKAAIEQQMANMMKDTSLDDFNRALAFFLYRNYVHYLNDSTEKVASTKRLKDAITTLPDYMNTKISLVEE
jgi:hypothetical protein